MAQQDYDAIIIGAGVIGAAVAFEMAKQGKKTLNVDKLPAAGYGSTSNSCAIIRTYYSTVDGSALALEGYHYWHNWEKYLGVEDESGMAKFIECGTLLMKTEHNDGLKPTMAIADQIGVEYEEWDREQILARMPVWDLNSFYPVRRPEDEHFGEPNGKQMEGAVFFPQGGYVDDPQLSTHNLQRAAEAHGAQFIFNRAVTAIEQSDGRVSGVTLDNGETIHAPVVVNVAGPHSFIINDMAGLTGTMAISTRALRHEVPHIPSPADFNYEEKGLVTSDSDIGGYTRPASGGKILIGSEDPPCDEREWVEDPDNYNRDITDQSRAQAMRIAQRFPGMGIPNQIQGAVDLYDVADDWIPIYDKTDLPGFYVAIGTSGNQYKNAPVAGKMMAALIEACENGQDHDADPVAFHMQHVDREISIGFFSRNRKINKNSSFSVLG